MTIYHTEKIISSDRESGDKVFIKEGDSKEGDSNSNDIIKSYSIYQGKQKESAEFVGEINIPKDLVVSEGEIIEKAGEKYLRLTLNNGETIDIAVRELCDVYKADDDETIFISNDNRIKGNYQAGTNIQISGNKISATDTIYNDTQIKSDISNLQTSKQDTLESGENIKTINGNNILGSGNIEIQGGGGGDSNYVCYGTCSTTASTKSKVVSVSNSFELKSGTIIGVKFTYTNTASNVTLNVNNTGAKQIWYNNSVYSSNSSDICGYASRINYYMYNGTYWAFLSQGIANSGTITGITMNGISKGTSGVVNLGTVLTSHQDISGKENVSNKITTMPSSPTDSQYPSAKLVNNSLNNKQDKLTKTSTLTFVLEDGTEETHTFYEE